MCLRPALQSTLGSRRQTRRAAVQLRYTFMRRDEGAGYLVWHGLEGQALCHLPRAAALATGGASSASRARVRRAAPCRAERTLAGSAAGRPPAAHVGVVEHVFDAFRRRVDQGAQLHRGQRERLLAVRPVIPAPRSPQATAAGAVGAAAMSGVRAPALAGLAAAARHHRRQLQQHRARSGQPVVAVRRRLPGRLDDLRRGVLSSACHTPPTLAKHVRPSSAP